MKNKQTLCSEVISLARFWECFIHQHVVEHYTQLYSYAVTCQLRTNRAVVNTQTRQYQQKEMPE